MAHSDKAWKLITLKLLLLLCLVIMRYSVCTFATSKINIQSVPSPDNTAMIRTQQNNVHSCLHVMCHLLSDTVRDSHG